MRSCRECGCTEFDACVVDGVPCSWVDFDLCSACAVVVVDADGPFVLDPQHTRRIIDAFDLPHEIVGLSPNR